MCVFQIFLTIEKLSRENRPRKLSLFSFMYPLMSKFRRLYIKNFDKGKIAFVQIIWITYILFQCQNIFYSNNLFLNLHSKQRMIINGLAAITTIFHISILKK